MEGGEFSVSKTDERIVSMKFEDSGFEAGATKAIEILNKLEDSLKLDGAAAGLDGLKNSLSGINMDGVNASLETAKSSFSIFGQIGIGALRKIGEEAMALSGRLLQSLGSRLTKGARDGFGEYQNQMNSLQTISANSGEEMSVIKDRLDELNEYADKTVYSFSEMTANIGRFTAAGLDVTTSTNAIKGFANMAALAGAGSQETSRGMYQLSQAMASGVVKLQDWKSIQNASIDTAAFKDILIETARTMNSTETSVDAAIEKQGSFNASLQEGWLTADVMSQALQVATMSTRDFSNEEEGMQQRLKELADMGYSEEVARKLINIANAADDSAREVRTFKQLTDTVEEAIGSGWAKTWELLIGDVEEATELFTTISKKFDELVGASADARNNLLKDWKDAGGRDSLIGSFANIVQAIANIIRPIKDAFTDVFSITGEALAVATENFALFTEKLVIGDDAMNAINAVFHATFMTIHEVIGILATGARFVGGFISLFVNGFSSVKSTLLPTITSVVEPIAKFVNKLHASFSKAVDDFSDMVYKINNNAKLWRDGILSNADVATILHDPLMVFVEMGKSVHNILSNLITLGKALVDGFVAIARTVWVIISPIRELIGMLASAVIFKAIPAVISLIDSAIAAFTNFYTTYINILTRMFKPIRRIFKEVYKTIANFFTAVYEVFTESKIFSILSSWYNGITGFFSDLLGKLGFSGEIFGHTIDWYFIHPFKALKDILVEFNKNHNVQSFKDWIKSITNVVGGPFTFVFSAANWVLEKLAWLITGPLADGFNLIKNWFSGLDIKNPFDGLFNWFSSLDISGFIGGLNIPNPFEGLVNWFKELDIPGFFSGVELPSFLSDWVNTLTTKFDELRGKSKSAKDGIKDFKKEVSKKTENKKGGLAKILDTLNELFGKLKKYLSELKGSGKSFTQMVQTVFIDAYNTMRRWLQNIANSGSGFGSTIASAFSFVLDQIEKIPQTLKNLFGKAETTTKDGATKLLNSSKEAQESAKGFLGGIFDNLPKLEDITGGLGGFFSGIVDSVTSGFANLLTGTDKGSLKAGLVDLFDFSDFKIVLPDLATPVGDFLDKFTEVLDKVPDERIETLTTLAGGWAKRLGGLWLAWNGNQWVRSLTKLNRGLGKEGEGIGKFFNDLPTAVTDGLKGLGDAFGQGVGKQFKAGMDSLSQGMKDFGKSFTPFKQSKAKSFLQVAEGIAALVGALWLMAQIPAEDLERASEALLKFALVSGALILFASWLATMANLDLKSVGIALAGLGIGLIGMAGAIWIFTQASKDDNFVVGMLNFKMVLEQLVLAMGILVVLSGGFGSKLAGLGATMLAMAVAITLLILPIKLLGGMDQPTLWRGLNIVENLAILITGCISLLSLAANNAFGIVAGGGAMLALVIAISAMIAPIRMFGRLKQDMLNQGLTVVENLSLLITGCISLLGLAAVNAFGIVAGGAAMIALAVALNLMIIPIKLLSTGNTNFDSALGVIENVSVILVGMVVALNFLSFNIVGILAGAAAMIILDLAVAGMVAVVGALSVLAKFNLDGLTTAIDALYYIVLAMAAMAAIGTFGAAGLIGLAAGITLVGLSLLALAAGIMLLQQGPDWGAISDGLGSIGAKAKELGSGLLEGVFNAIDSARQNLGSILNTAASAMYEAWCSFWQQNSPSKLMESSGENIIQGAINGILNMLGLSESTGTEAGTSILDGFDAAGIADNLGQKATEAMTAFMDGLDTEALAQKGGDMVAGLLKGIGEDLQNKMATKASEVFHSFVDPIAQFFGINSPSTYMQNEIGANIIQGLINGLSFLGGLSDKVAEIGGIITGGLSGLPSLFGIKGTESVESLSSSLTTASTGVGTAAAQMAVQASSGLLDFASLVGTKGSEGAESFVQGFSNKTGNAKTETVKMTASVLTEMSALKPKARSKANEAMNAFCSGISAAAGRARSAATAVMNAAASGIGSLWGRFYNTGKNAADGLAAGIYAGLGAARAAADRLMAEAEKAANARAKIKSPSRVFMGIGEYLGEGLAIGMNNTRAEVSKASSNLAGATFDSFKNSLSTMSIGLDDLLETDYSPVITPVIDPTEFDSSIGRLATRMNSLAPNDLSIGTVNYNQEFASKLSDYADVNRQAIAAVANNAIDYDILGVAVANALIRSGVHVEMDSGEFVGYLAGEINDVRRMYM